MVILYSAMYTAVIMEIYFFKCFKYVSFELDQFHNPFPTPKNLTVQFQVFLSSYRECGAKRVRVDTHLCKLRDTPAARFYRCIIL